LAESFCREKSVKRLFVLANNREWNIQIELERPGFETYKYLNIISNKRKMCF
jgi:hypothetical protein